MKKRIHIAFTGVVLCLLAMQQPQAQGVLPVYRYTYAVPKILDKTATASSFAYSLRKIRKIYTGYAVRIREGSGTASAEADVSFDATGIVSTNSTVTVTAAGSTSGFTVGQVLTLSSFKGSQSVYVKTWYDQGATAYHASQNTASLQPELVFNSAGASNNKPSLLFTGAEYLDVGQPIQNLVNSGINGSFLLWTKPTASVTQESFGYWAPSPSAYRWSVHLNWSDGRLYFDAGENCCAANRAFINSANLNIYKLYTLVRGTSYKTVHINGATTALNNSAATSTSASGGSFYIGWAANGPDAKYKGNLCEVIMFPTDLSTTNLQPVETDQINFWSN